MPTAHGTLSQWAQVARGSVVPHRGFRKCETRSVSGNRYKASSGGCRAHGRALAQGHTPCSPLGAQMASGYTPSAAPRTRHPAPIENLERNNRGLREATGFPKPQNPTPVPRTDGTKELEPDGNRGIPQHKYRHVPQDHPTDASQTHHRDTDASHRLFLDASHRHLPQTQKRPTDVSHTQACLKEAPYQHVPDTSYIHFPQTCFTNTFHRQRHAPRFGQTCSGPVR